MNNYFIIHGTYGHPEENWFPWLKKELESKKIECIVPQFPIGDEQNYNNWKETLDDYSDKINENTIFICHSIAPIFIIKYILDNKIKIFGIITVSGFNSYIGPSDEINKCNQSFFMNEDNILDIYNYCNFILSFYSDNDPYIKFVELERFARVLKAEKYLIKNAGHFNIVSGYKEFPKILDIIKDINNNLDLRESDDLPIGINFIIVNNNNQILLGRRINCYGSGTYSLFGAKLKNGESIEECVIREAKEELDINVKDIKVLNIASTITTRHMLQIGVLIDKYEGIPKILEPHKCDDIRFFNLDELPELFVGTKANIELYIENKIYDKEKNIETGD